MMMMVLFSFLFLGGGEEGVQIRLKEKSMDGPMNRLLQRA